MATITAGAMVTSSVADYALMLGSPERRVGWVGPAEVPVQTDGSWWRCPVEGRRFVEDGEVLEERP